MSQEFFDKIVKLINKKASFEVRAENCKIEPLHDDVKDWGLMRVYSVNDEEGVIGVAFYLYHHSNLKPFGLSYHIFNEQDDHYDIEDVQLQQDCILSFLIRVCKNGSAEEIQESTWYAFWNERFDCPTVVKH